MKNYLAYGSNLLPARLRERVPSAMPVGVVKLTGWSLHFHKRSNIDGSGKCNIRNCGSENATVYGAIYGVAKNEIPRLDEAEGL